MTGTNHPRYYPVLDNEVGRLWTIAEKGLHPVYSSFNEFLYDFWPDFAWCGGEAQLQQLNDLLGSEEWLNAAKVVKDRRGYDFKAEIEAAKAEIEAELKEAA